MNACRGCGGGQLQRVLDLGAVPAADHFPPAAQPLGAQESSHALAMDLCDGCGLAQLASDDTVTAEPRGIEPQALRDQAAEAVSRVSASGWLTGATVHEFGSPHGGSWLGLLAGREFTPVGASTGAADVVLDCFGIMHEPDQRAAFAARAAATAADGVLLLQYHCLAAIVEQGQWNALRHGHFAYYSRRALEHLLNQAGMSIVESWQFDLYGGTELVAAVHASRLQRLRTRAVSAPGCVDSELERGVLQRAADNQVIALRCWLLDRQREGVRVYGYGAASRAVSLFAMAGLDRTLIGAVADAAPGKQGRRMPGTDIPIIAPDTLVDVRPDLVLLTVPDMLPEVISRLPRLAGRWVSIDRLPSRS